MCKENSVSADNIIESLSNNMAKIMCDSIADSIVNSITKNMRDSIAHSIADSVANSVSDGIANSIADSITDSVANSVANSVSDNMREDIRDNMTNSMRDVIRDNMDRSTGDSIDQNMADSMAKYAEPSGKERSGKEPSGLEPSGKEPSDFDKGVRHMSKSADGSMREIIRGNMVKSISDSMGDNMNDFYPPEMDIEFLAWLVNKHETETTPVCLTEIDIISRACVLDHVVTILFNDDSKSSGMNSIQIHELDFDRSYTKFLKEHKKFRGSDER